MARMIPATLSLETESSAEGKIFHALRDSLDNTYTIFHSVDLLTHNLRNQKSEFRSQQSAVRRKE